MYQDPELGLERLQKIVGKTVAKVSFENDWPQYILEFTDGSKIVFAELGQAGWIAIEE
jgi:hypothetical protein